MTRRRLLVTLAAAFMTIGIQAGSPPPVHAVTQVSASIDFYDELSPYGGWERVPRYGDCWVPLDVPVGWRPYTVGYWVDTDYGWMWVSEDPWGEIPYHYGRWAYDSYYGWVWVPDDDEIWAPAWVAWRYGDDYVGWAPLPPDARWRSGSGLTIDVSILDRRINRSGWCFTPVSAFGSTRIRSSILTPSRNVTLISRTRNMTRYEVYNSLPAERGLRPEILERATGRRFQRYQVMDSRSPAQWKHVAIQGRTIEAYRPRITGVRSERARLMPRVGGPSRGTVQRQESEQRRFDQRMRQERGALQREHQRELSQQSRSGARQDEMRQRQQAEMRAQQEREAQERRSLDQRRRIAEERGQRQRPPRERGRGQGQTQERPDQGQAQDQGKGQGKDKGQSKDKGPDQSKGQSQDDQDKDHGRGRGHGKGGN